MSNAYVLAAILVMFLITFALRALPFLIFQKEVPQWLLQMGKVLPAAIMAMLVVYCLKDVSFLHGNHGIPELLSIVVLFLLHKWKHMTLLSIIGGTCFYMFLVQFVFI